MTDAPIDFRIPAGAGVPVREFKAGDVIFRQGDDAKERSSFDAASNFRP